MTGDARAWVLLDFMGKETRVQVDRQQIKAVSPIVFYNGFDAYNYTFLGQYVYVVLLKI